MPSNIPVWASTQKRYDPWIVEDFKKYIADYPNFPIEGVLFRDISPLLKNPKIFASFLDSWSSMLDWSAIDYVCGIESRGFILASALAQKNQKGFVMIRKAGKLPPPILKKACVLEYGKAVLEMFAGDGRVLIIDDVLATGGTLNAAIELCQEAGYTVEQVSVMINLTFLNQMTFRGRAIPSVVQY